MKRVFGLQYPASLEPKLTFMQNISQLQYQLRHQKASTVSSGIDGGKYNFNQDHGVELKM